MAYMYGMKARISYMYAYVCEHAMWYMYVECLYEHVNVIYSEVQMLIDVHRFCSSYNAIALLLLCASTWIRVIIPRRVHLQAKIQKAT